MVENPVYSVRFIFLATIDLLLLTWFLSTVQNSKISGQVVCSEIQIMLFSKDGKLIEQCNKHIFHSL